MIPAMEQQGADASFLTLVSLIADKYQITYTVDTEIREVRFDCGEEIAIPLAIEFNALINEQRIRR